jgi:hypothetical protein
LFATFSEKSFPSGISKERSHMGLNQDCSGASSHAKRLGNQFVMTHESKVSCRKSKTTFAVCDLAPSCM